MEGEVIMAKKDEKEKKDNEKNEEPKEAKGIGKIFTRLNDVSRDILKTINHNTYKSEPKVTDEIDRLSDIINNVINEEIDDIKSYGGEDISTFILRTLNDRRDEKQTPTAGMNNIKKLNDDFKSIEDLFSGDNGDIFNAFNERYKNELLLFEDLDTITHQLIELDEAINTTRDAIVTADDLGSYMSRNIKMDTLSEDDKKMYLNIIKEMEEKFKLPNKIKNHIIPKGLTYGNYYAYIIPQSKIFENCQKDRIKMNKHRMAFESAEFEEEIEAITESVVAFNMEEEQKTFGFAPKRATVAEQARAEVVDYLEDFVTNIEICNDDVPLPLLESDLLSAREDLLKFNDEFKRAVDGVNSQMSKSKPSDNPFAAMDGVVGTKASKKDKDGNKEIEDFSFINDCYIKLISPKQMRPIEIMNYPIGYYYSYATDATTTKKKKGKFTSNFNIQNFEKTAQGANILDNITNKIVKSFDKKYLENNKEFKELIMNSLLYHKAYNKTLHFQFIPAEYVCEFKVNEDEDGHGHSMLEKSLFYAKLYLALLMYTLITYMSRSADTRIYYVKNSGIDTNYSNKVQEIARDIKSKQIKFTDLLSYNSITSKVGAGREIFMPVGKSGERGIEFDILSGQDVPLQNDLMEMLKQGYINGTGVPSVIMNYINEADYAKTLVMANAKYLARVVSYQLDFNPSITKMYRMILAFSTNIPREVISTIEFSFLPPKALTNNNFTELTQYGDNIIDFLNRAVFGENSEQTEDMNMAKDLFRNKMSRDLMPFLPWEDIDKALNDSILEAKERMETKRSQESGGSTE